MLMVIGRAMAGYSILFLGIRTIGGFRILAQLHSGARFIKQEARDLRARIE